ncbi:MAG: cytochrome c biogenesis protein CcdA [Clostridia bacterium]
MINQWLETLGSIIGANPWLAPVLALIAGILTSFTPCSLSGMPLVIGYVGGYAGGDTKKAFRYSLVFCLGMSVTFTTLGIAASLLGRLMSGAGSWWYVLIGILMVLMALQTWEIINFIPQPALMEKSSRKGYIGAALTGLLGGLFASPCATPVLVVLLAMVAKGGNLVLGIVLLLMYSIGHSALLLLAGTFVGLVKKISVSEKFGKYSMVFKVIMGMFILALGLYMFYLGF